MTGIMSIISACASNPFDAAVIAEHLRRHGVAVEETGSRFGADGEGPSIYLLDPEGNRVELKGPPVA